VSDLLFGPTLSLFPYLLRTCMQVLSPELWVLPTSFRDHNSCTKHKTQSVGRRVWAPVDSRFRRLLPSSKTTSSLGRSPGLQQAAPRHFVSSRPAPPLLTTSCALCLSLSGSAFLADSLPSFPSSGLNVVRPPASQACICSLFSHSRLFTFLLLSFFTSHLPLQALSHLTWAAPRSPPPWPPSLHAVEDPSPSPATDRLVWRLPTAPDSWESHRIRSRTD